MRRERYSVWQRVLHWVIAVLVLWALASGFTIYLLGFEGVTEFFGVDGRDALYKYHKSAGVLILGLMVLRVLFRIWFETPSHRGRLSSVEKDLSGAVHAYLYLALLVMPIVGWLATDYGGYPVHLFEAVMPEQVPDVKETSEALFVWHFYIGLVILGLVFVHIGAAMRHWLVIRDHVMRRMGFF